MPYLLRTYLYLLEQLNGPQVWMPYLLRTYLYLFRAVKWSSGLDAVLIKKLPLPF